jgi:hypothetical protein
MVCPVRPGEPRVLMTTPSDQPIGAIVVDNDTIYYGTNPNQGLGEVRAMPLAGGPSRQLVADVTARGLYLDGPTLYYVHATGAPRATLSAVLVGGSSSKDIATANGLDYVAFDASGIYFADRGPGPGASRIMFTDRSGSPPTPVVNLVGVLWGFAVDQFSIYWAEYASGGMLQRRDLAGGVTTTLLSSTEPINSPMVDGDDIVYIEGTNTPDTCRSRVMLIDHAGAHAPWQISTGSSGVDVWKVARNGPNLYWVSSGIRGAVFRSEQARTPEVLAADQASAWGLVTNATDVYWIARANTTYVVRSVPK